MEGKESKIAQLNSREKYICFKVWPQITSGESILPGSWQTCNSQGRSMSPEPHGAPNGHIFTSSRQRRKRKADRYIGLNQRETKEKKSISS